MLNTDHDMPYASSLEHIEKLTLVYGRLGDILFDLSAIPELDVNSNVLTESSEHCHRAVLMLGQLTQALVKLPQKHAPDVIIVRDDLSLD